MAIKYSFQFCYRLCVATFQQTTSYTFIFLIITNIRLATSQQCTRRPLELTIRLNNCIPKTIPALACAGSCSSYTRPSSDFPGEMEHFCQCCDIDESVSAPVRLFCPGLRRRLVQIMLKVPLSCKCRPCSERPENVLPSEAEQRVWGRNKRMHGNFSINATSNTTRTLNLVSFIKTFASSKLRGYQTSLMEEKALNFTLGET